MASQNILPIPATLSAEKFRSLLTRVIRRSSRPPKLSIPRLPDHLKALHQFSEELKEGTGGISLYNEGLGTVSESYMYDRVRGRDLPESERPKRPWQQLANPDKRRA